MSDYVKYIKVCGKCGKRAGWFRRFIGSCNNCLYTGGFSYSFWVCKPVETDKK